MLPTIDGYAPPDSPADLEADQGAVPIDRIPDANRYYMAEVMLHPEQHQAERGDN